MVIPSDLPSARKQFKHAQLYADADFLEKCDPLISELFYYWQNKSIDGAIPLRTDLLPEEMFLQLPYIFIVDGDGENSDFRYLLMGENEILARKNDPTGKTVIDACVGTPELALFNYQFVHAHKSYLFMESNIFNSEKLDIRDQTLFLPVSLNGEDVDQVLAIGIQHRIHHNENGMQKSRVRQRWENGQI